MSNNKQNSKDNFGDIPFFVFYSTVLSRLAYFTSQSFLPSYLDIFGPIIKTSLMKDINNAPIDKIFDPSIYKTSISKERIPVFNYQGTDHIDFKEMARQINDINIKFVKRRDIINTSSNLDNNQETQSFSNIPVKEISGDDYTVAYISIATSNYAGYYILVDTRMPNSIFVIFRGTYSAKSAGSYTKVSSLVPFNIANNIPPEELQKLLQENEGKMFGVLIGINKILDDVYHSIIESMVYLSQTYLKASKPNSIKVYTTGHSLGGALTTLFSADWMEYTKISPYNSPPYNIFSNKICCVSIAAPRVLSPAYSNYFCEKTIQGNILYRRLTNRGDPVPALPSKSIVGLSEGFQHPCSAKKYKDTQRQVINLDCSSTQKGNNIDYNKPLNCRKTKTSMMSGNLSGNALAHTAYLYINYFNAVDLRDIGASNLPSQLKKRTSELTRTKSGATNTRIILAVANQIGNSTDMDFKSIFFTLNDLRPKPIDNVDPNTKPIVSSDLLMNQKVFKQLIDNMKPMDFDDLNPISSKKIFTPTVMKKDLMPKITGIFLPNKSQTITQSAGKKIRPKKRTRNKKHNKHRKY